MVKGHFPKKGERKVNGVWKPAEDKAVPVVKRTMTAADRRNWLNKKAGWPVKEAS